MYVNTSVLLGAGVELPEWGAERKRGSPLRRFLFRSFSCRTGQFFSVTSFLPLLTFANLDVTCLPGKDDREEDSGPSSGIAPRLQ